MAVKKGKGKVRTQANPQDNKIIICSTEGELFDYIDEAREFFRLMEVYFEYPPGSQTASLVKELKPQGQLGDIELGEGIVKKVAVEGEKGVIQPHFGKGVLGTKFREYPFDPFGQRFCINQCVKYSFMGTPPGPAQNVTSLGHWDTFGKKSPVL